MKNENVAISLIIVDDHPVVRSGLEAMLLSEKGFAILGTAASGQEAIALCERKGRPDVVLMDIRMPEMDGFQTLERMRRRWPELRVLLLAGMPLKNEETRAKELGARGYISKSTEQDRLLAEIRHVARDGAYFARDVYAETESVLTPRETEVLRLLSLGRSREDIALVMGIGAETVKSHVKSIMGKLGVDGGGRTEAVARGYELGILRP